MFMKFSIEGKIAVLIVYINDIILTGDDVIEMNNLKSCLVTKFELKDLGSLKYFLGMEVAHSKKGVVSQRRYVFNLLEETGMSGCRLVDTLMDPNMKLWEKGKGTLVYVVRYQRLVGKLICLRHTQPDIAFTVSMVSQFMHAPYEEHLKVV